MLVSLLVFEFQTQHIGQFFYSGGSKSEYQQFVGCAAVVFRPNHPTTIHKFRLPQETSVYRAEILAILQAIHLIIGEAAAKEQYAIYSDSLSSLHALNNPFTTDPTAREIHQLVNSNQLDVLFAYVRGHQNTPGNIQADEAAKDAITNPDSHIINWTTPPNVKAAARTRTRREWDKHLREDRTGLWTKSLLGTSSTDAAHLLENLRLFCNSRTDHVLINRTISGHLPTNAYLHRFKLRDNPDCQHCNATETIEHIIFSCPAYLHLKFLHTNLFLQPSEHPTLSINNPRCIPLILNILRQRF